jgi:hypothetical protein
MRAREDQDWIYDAAADAGVVPKLTKEEVATQVAQVSAKANYDSAANAVENAKNPTQAQINRLKDATTKLDATRAPATDVKSTIAAAEKTVADIGTTIGEIDTTINDINAIYGDIGRITGESIAPLSTVSPEKAISQETMDAFALLKDTFKNYGLESLVSKIEGYMRDNIGPNQATVLLKQTEEYKERFAGNETRRKAGKNVLDEGTYIGLENRMRELLSAYGQDRYATQTEFADLIANDISPTELNTRLDLAVNQVKNADPNILSNLKQFYPSISDADLVSYFLKPEQALVDLQQKVTASEIGAAAQEQNLSPLDTARMLELQRLGVTQESARSGFQKVATVLPTSEYLSDIYGEAKIDYTQRTAEEEFLQGNASAARKRRQLAQLEEASFSGSSGVDRGSLDKSLQGKF